MMQILGILSKLVLGVVSALNASSPARNLKFSVSCSLGYRGEISGIVFLATSRGLKGGLLVSNGSVAGADVACWGLDDNFSQAPIFEGLLYFEHLP